MTKSLPVHCARCKRLLGSWNVSHDPRTSTAGFPPQPSSCWNCRERPVATEIELAEEVR